MLSTPLYRLRTEIFTAVLPSRRMTETQLPASWPRYSLQDRRRNPRSPDRRYLAPAMGPPTQRGLRKLITYVNLHGETAIRTPQLPRLLQAKSKPPQVLNAMNTWVARKIKTPSGFDNYCKRKNSLAAPSGQNIIHYRKQHDLQSPRRRAQHSTRFPEGSQHHARCDVRPQADHVQRSQRRCQH